MNFANCVVAGLAILFLASDLQAQEAPKPATPQKEHEWLKQFVGEWESDMHGTETARMLGGLWLVSEQKADVMGKDMHAILTLGYDPEKKKYIGTWIDTMMGILWVYEGTVDPTGKIITLEAEGPSFTTPGKKSKYRDAWEFKDKDTKVLTSSVQGEDGKWTTFLTLTYTRKK
jgi:hypothetical protein